MCPAAGEQLASSDPCSGNSYVQKTPGDVPVSLSLPSLESSVGMCTLKCSCLRTGQLLSSFGNLEKKRFWGLMEIEGVN